MAASRRSALDGLLAIELAIALALIAGSLPSPVIETPKKLAGLRPMVCLLPDPDNSRMLGFVVSSARYPSLTRR